MLCAHPKVEAWVGMPPTNAVKTFLEVKGFHMPRSGECEVTPSLPLISGSLWSGVLLFIWVSSTDQMDVEKLFVLDRNTWNHELY